MLIDARGGKSSHSSLPDPEEKMIVSHLWKDIMAFKKKNPCSDFFTKLSQ